MCRVAVKWAESLANDRIRRLIRPLLELPNPNDVYRKNKHRSDSPFQETPCTNGLKAIQTTETVDWNYLQ